ncbi:hypothetical protein R1sor_016133 [Riccia sorocarpa]|uniref:Uncharacterized protein n=1 Tax=Riccia sorocarpa TaxID=122646 RepID=A0ABD3HKB6_9MARC
MTLEKFLLDHGLRISVDDTKGRCLIANRVFTPGELIISQEPYSSVLDIDSERRRCDNCFNLSSNVKRCSACKSVRYCCSSCQVHAWKQQHKSECQMLVKLIEEKQRTPPPSLRLVVRLVIKRSLQQSGVLSTKADDNFETVEALPTHYSETQEERLVSYAQMANLVKTIVDPVEVDLKEVCQLFCRIACNAHTICDEEFRPVGTGLYPVISIINHSCAPNTVLLFNGKRGIVRALQKIEKGTEVTVSYVELAGSTKTRQLALKEQYYFVCQCKRCRKMETEEGIIEDAILEGYKCPVQQCNGAVPSGRDQPGSQCVTCGSGCDNKKLKRSESAANKLLEEANLAMRSRDDGQARLLFEKTEAIQKEIFHVHSVHLMRTRDALMKVCMSLNDWQSALRYCLLTLPAYERAYSVNSPLVGLQYFSLGKLHWLLGNSREAVTALTRAKGILSVTHGSGSSLVRELTGTLQEATLEAAYRSQIPGGPEPMSLDITDRFKHHRSLKR